MKPFVKTISDHPYLFWRKDHTKYAVVTLPQDLCQTYLSAPGALDGNWYLLLNRQFAWQPTEQITLVAEDARQIQLTGKLEDSGFQKIIQHLQNATRQDAVQYAEARKTRPLLRSMPTESVSLRTLPFSEKVACDYADGAWKELDEPTPLTRSVDAPVAFQAVAPLLAQSKVLVRGIDLSDGTRYLEFDYKKEGFSFDELFEDFVSDNTKNFLFDDVKISVEQSEGSEKKDTLVFSGKLRLDTDDLKPLQTFLGLSDGLAMFARIQVGTESVSSRLKPRMISLTSTDTLFKPLMNGVTLKQGQLALTLNSEKKDDKTVWNFHANIAAKADCSTIAKNIVELEATLDYEAKVFKFHAATEKLENAFGIDGLALNAVELNGEIGTKKQLDFTADWAFESNATVAFQGILGNEGSGIAAQFKNFSTATLNSLFKKIANADLELPDFDLQWDAVTLGLTTQKMELQGETFEKGVSFVSKVTVQEHVCKGLATLNPTGFEFKGSLGNIELGPLHIQETGLVLNVAKAKSDKKTGVALYGKTQIQGIKLSCQVAYEKVDKKWGAVVYGLLDATRFGLRNLFPEVEGTFVDGLAFSKVALIYSTQNQSEKNPDLGTTVKEGIQLLGQLNEIPVLSTLTKNKQMGLALAARLGKTTDISIELPDTRLSLGKGVLCDPFKIVITLKPKPALMLIFGMDVTIPNQAKTLHFDFSLEIGALAANGAITMKNWWENAFGVNRLKVGPELAVQLGINYVTFASSGLPTEFGIAGGLALGDVQAKMAVKISENPKEMILMGDIDALTPKNLVSFISEVAAITIPNEAVPDFFELNKLKLYVAPSGGKIGTIEYEQGFSFNGDLVVLGKRVSVAARLGTDGMTISGHLDRIEIGPLKIGGKIGHDVALDVQLTALKQSLFLDAAVDFLGMQKGIYLNMSNKGIQFDFEENFFDLLKYKVHVESTGSIKKPLELDFKLSALFENELTTYMKTVLADKLRAAIQVVETDIAAAQRKVDEAKAAYLRVFEPANKALTDAQKAADDYLKKCQNDVAQERQKYKEALDTAQRALKTAQEAYSSAFDTAQRAVNDAKSAYNSALYSAQRAVDDANRAYNSAMSSARSAVESARQSYESAFAPAQNAVDSAQNSVNGLLNDIEQCKRDIADTSGWRLDQLAWLGTKLAGLYTAYGTATAALDTANAILEGIKKGSSFVVFDTAQKTLTATETGVQYAAFNTAQAALEGVKQGGRMALTAAEKTLEGVKKGTLCAAWKTAEDVLRATQETGNLALETVEGVLGKVATSATYIALEAAKKTLNEVAKGTAAVAFDTATLALKAAKLGATTILKLAELVAKHIGDLVDVRRVSLAAQWSGIAKNGYFDATIDIAILGQPYNWNVHFSVRDIQSFIESLFNKVLDQAKLLVA